jgi:hypothetical protein
MSFSFTKVSAFILNDLELENFSESGLAVLDEEDIYENYITLFEYSQLLDFQSQSIVEVSGEILSYSYKHDFDVFSLCLEDYMTITFDFDFPSPYLFVEFYSDNEVDQYYPFDYNLEDASDIINRYRNDGYYSETQLENGITLPAGRYFVLVSTSSVASYLGNGIDYSFSVEKTPVVFDEAISADFMVNAGIDAAVWTSTFQQEYHYLYDDENPESTSYPVQYSKDTEAYEFYQDLLETTDAASDIPDGDYLYKRIFMFSPEFQYSLLSLITIISNEYQQIQASIENSQAITGVFLDFVSLVPIFKITGADLIFSKSLNAIVDEIYNQVEKERCNALLNYIKENYELFAGLNLVELLEPVLLAENFNPMVMYGLGSVIYNDIINNNNQDYRYFDIIASKRISESESLESLQTVNYYIRTGDGYPLVLGPDFRDDEFGSGREYIVSDSSAIIFNQLTEEDFSLSKTTGIMEYIGGDGGVLDNLGEDTGYFVDNSTEPLIEGDNLYVFDDYYTTYRHYSFKTYEYFDRVAFKIYKKRLFDSYQTTLYYYIDESPSTSSSATDYTYERYYLDQQIYSSIYASTYFYAYVDGANRKIYLKDRSNVSTGDYYVKEVNVNEDYFKLYRSTTVSGWYNTTKYDFRSGDYYYDYYYSSIPWTDYLGYTRNSYLRYQKSFVIFG